MRIYLDSNGHGQRKRYSSGHDCVCMCVCGCHECVITGFVLPVVLLTVCSPYRRAVCPFGFKLLCLAEFDLTGLNF